MTEPEATWSPAGRAAPRRRPGAAPLRVAAVGAAAFGVALRLLLAAAVVAAPAVGRAPARHPDSLSTTLVEIQGDEALLSMQLQVLSVLEVVEGLDADGDGEITAAELDARRAEVFAYVLGHYLLWTGTDRDMEGGVPLMPEPLELVFEPPGPAAGYRKGTVTVTFVLRHEAKPAQIDTDSTF